MPGSEEGGSYSSSFFNAMIASNALGQAAFQSILSSSDGESASNAIFAEDLRGEIQIIVRTGDTLDVSDDPQFPELRTIERLYFQGDDGFNDRGQLAFVAQFTDDTSGVFVSDLVAIPEPTSLSILVIFTLMASLATRSPR